MVWGWNFKHSSVRLDETIYIKCLYYKKSIQWNTYSQQLVIYRLGKAANPPDISVVGVCEFYKISNSPTPFLRTQNNVANFPLPRGREGNSSPFIPRHIPLVGPGSYPRGKPMTCALSPVEIFLAGSSDFSDDFFNVNWVGLAFSIATLRFPELSRHEIFHCSKQMVHNIWIILRDAWIRRRFKLILCPKRPLMPSIASN